ncbi:hypothetical protein [Methylocapsa sp. S129]|uniref:hypothetical protein n=1 Tax=Methylocapsa sp. S129 TaxID=1641869 RepID=UPI00131EC20A|nr:hypothetical protein [Methylocapsa sp. S129]
MSDVSPSPRTGSIGALSQLDVGERLFIWGFRAMAQHHKLGRPSIAELRQVFGHFGVGDAVFSLEALLDAFARAAHSPVEVHGMGCPCVSTSETFLLRAVAATQSGALEVARREFARWLPCPAADWVLIPVAAMGRLFQRAGLTMLLREAEPAPMPDTMAMRTWPVGSRTLH